MINTRDFKIEIGFDIFEKPYYKVSRKGEPYWLSASEEEEASRIFIDLAMLANEHAGMCASSEQYKKKKSLIEKMDVDDARKLLSIEGKRLWVDINNAATGGGGYAIDANGNIVDVPMEGVWK